jgi:hypothetical protein
MEALLVADDIMVAYQSNVLVFQVVICTVNVSRVKNIKNRKNGVAMPRRPILLRY